MNVLTLTSCYPVEHSPSDGIFVRSQCEALQAAGTEVTVLAPRPWVPPGFQAFCAKWRTYRRTPVFYRLNGIPVYRPRYLAPPRSDLWMPVHWQHVRAALRLIHPKPDIIHAHFAYPGGLAGVRLGAAWGVPLVLTLHGDDTNVHPLRHRRTLRQFREAVRGAGEVLAVSRALAQQAESLAGRLPTRLPIGVDLRKFDGLPSRAEARAQLGLPFDRPLMLYVGRLLKTKGVQELLRAHAGLAEPKPLAVFVGSGPLATEVRSAPWCRWAGVQPNERIPLFMRAADLLALPSYSEGLPTVLVEAGAAGLPVVSTHVGGIPELLSDGRGYLIAPQSVEALRAALHQAITHPDEAAGCAARLRATVRAHYDARKNAEDLLGIYRGLQGQAQPLGGESCGPHLQKRPMTIAQYLFG